MHDPETGEIRTVFLGRVMLELDAEDVQRVIGGLLLAGLVCPRALPFWSSGGTVWRVEFLCHGLKPSYGRFKRGCSGVWGHTCPHHKPGPVGEANGALRSELSGGRELLDISLHK